MVRRTGWWPFFIELYSWWGKVNFLSISFPVSFKWISLWMILYDFKMMPFMCAIFIFPKSFRSDTVFLLNLKVIIVKGMSPFSIVSCVRSFFKRNIFVAMPTMWIFYCGRWRWRRAAAIIFFERGMKFRMRCVSYWACMYPKIFFLLKGRFATMMSMLLKVA